MLLCYFSISVLRKGEQWVDNWMSENCKLVETDNEMASAVSLFIAFKEQFRGIPGAEHLNMIRCDFFFLWPNSLYFPQMLSGTVYPFAFDWWFQVSS